VARVARRRVGRNIVFSKIRVGVSCSRCLDCCFQVRVVEVAERKTVLQVLRRFKVPQ
jgi:hypothetical protein